MPSYIRYREKMYRAVRLHIRTDSDFNDILNELNELVIPEAPISGEQIIYAILELINNSLRAHKEKSIRKKILAEFSITSDMHLQITIQDWGGGFDTSGLPYDLNGDPDSVDTNSETFQNYREEHGYMRFGIGLYVVKKTFDSFHLYFIDEDRNPVSWESGKAAGTCIELQLFGKNGEGDSDG